ncbi:unnamed protein product, partial [Meganyctiphanes norvegica]
KVTIAACFNIPFTVRAPLYPYTNYMVDNDWKMLEIQRPEKKIERLELPQITGISLTSLAVDYPGPYYELFPYPHSARTLKFWSWQVWYDPSKSTTKAVTLSMSYARPKESMESKSWGQPINPVTRLVDFGRQRLFAKRPDLFSRDPNVQRYTGKFSLEGTTEDMIRPVKTDLWQPESLNKEPLMKPPFLSTRYNKVGMASGKLMVNSPLQDETSPMSYYSSPDVYINMTGPYKSFQDANNRIGRGWTSNYGQNSYGKYRANDDDVEVFAMFGSQMGYDSADHELHQNILSKYSNLYFNDQPQTWNPESDRRFSVTNERNKSQHVPADDAHSLQLLDYDD